MSYYAEHLAWQQRVGQEMRRQNSFEKWNTPKQWKTFYKGMSSTGSEPFYSQWTKDNYKTANSLTNDAVQNSLANYTSNPSNYLSKPQKDRKNLQNYTFGGMTSIRQTPLYQHLGKTGSDHNLSSDVAMSSGREVLTGFGQSQLDTKNPGQITLQRPTKPKVPNFFDQAYYTDPKKRAKDRPQSCKSGYSRKSTTLQRMKAYKAENPYQKSGSYFYRSNKPDEKPGKVDKKDDERFNEAVSVTSKQVTADRKSRRSNRSKRRIMRDDASKRSTIDALQHELEKRREVTQLNQGELGNEQNNDYGKAYNTIDVDRREARQTLDPNIDQFEAEEEKSNTESKASYAVSLKREIEEERQKRIELEKQIEELKAFHKSVTTQLGLNPGTNGL